MALQKTKIEMTPELKAQLLGLRAKIVEPKLNPDALRMLKEDPNVIEGSFKRVEDLRTLPEALMGNFKALIPAPIVEIETLPETRDSQFNRKFIWNTKQQLFIDTALSGESIVLIGAAGSGKTSVTKGYVAIGLSSGTIGLLAEDTKYLYKNSPGIVCVSYTNRAVGNLRRAMQDAGLGSNCLTIHKLLEFGPQFYEVQDPITREIRNKVQFIPKRDRFNPLPRSLKKILIDEASMVGTDLWAMLIDALPDPKSVQFIFIGDINQLPPVFGPAILGFKMLELKVIELTEIYRQALDSPIIRIAHHVKNGRTITMAKNSKGKPTMPEQWQFPEKLITTVWQDKLSNQVALSTLGKVFFKKQYELGVYNPIDDVILIPYGNANNDVLQVSAWELNKYIAQFLGVMRQAVIHEVIAGYVKHYYAVGDKVLFNKEDYVITDIKRNISYLGVRTVPATITLDRWGHEQKQENAKIAAGMQDADDSDNIDFIFEQLAKAAAAGEERVVEASHIFKLKKLLDNEEEEEIEIKTAGEVNNMLFGYAITVHKAQGSEWRKVFFIAHHSHHSINRELLYTAFTRARECLHIICEPDTLIKGVIRQKIKGTTLAEKAEYFKGKVNPNEIDD